MVARLVGEGDQRQRQHARARGHQMAGRLVRGREHHRAQIDAVGHAAGEVDRAGARSSAAPRRARRGLPEIDDRVPAGVLAGGEHDRRVEAADAAGLRRGPRQVDDRALRPLARQHHRGRPLDHHRLARDRDSVAEAFAVKRVEQDVRPLVGAAREPEHEQRRGRLLVDQGGLDLELVAVGAGNQQPLGLAFRIGPRRSPAPALRQRPTSPHPASGRARPAFRSPPGSARPARCRPPTAARPARRRARSRRGQSSRQSAPSRRRTRAPPASAIDWRRDAS